MIIVGFGMFMDVIKVKFLLVGIVPDDMAVGCVFTKTVFNLAVWSSFLIACFRQGMAV